MSRWNADGKYLYSGGGEAVLVKWNVAEARREEMAPRLGDVVEEVHVAGETIVARLADGTAHSFDTQLKIQERNLEICTSDEFAVDSFDLDIHTRISKFLAG